VPSITYGMTSNIDAVSICFRIVTSKILQPRRIVFIQVDPRSCVPDCLVIIDLSQDGRNMKAEVA